MQSSIREWIKTLAALALAALGLWVIVLVTAGDPVRIIIGVALVFALGAYLAERRRRLRGRLENGGSDAHEPRTGS